MPTIISADGTRIAYSTWGQGPALILVDGAFCFRENGLTPKLAPLLAKHFTVYAYDRRGRGESANTLPYDVSREIEDLQAMMAAAGGAAFVFGISSGAALALRAVAAGLPATKLAMYEPPFIPATGTAPTFEASARTLARLAADGRRGEAVHYFMTHVFGAPAFFVAIMKYVMRRSWRMNESVAHTLPYDLAILGDGSVPPEAAAIRLPSLVMGGAKAPQKLQDAVTRTSAAVPGAERRMLAGQSHNVNPAVLTAALADYFLKP